MISLTAIPAHAKISLMGPMTHEYDVKSGSVYEDELVVRNSGTEEMIIKLEIRDYFFSSDGTSNYMDPGSLDRSNASWIKLEKTRVSIAPDTSAKIKFSVTVPNDENLSGTYWSIVMIEPQSEIKVGEGDQKAVNLTLHETIRYGVQIVTTVGASGRKQLEFTKTSLNSNEDSTLALYVDLQNVGDRWLRPDVWVDLFKEDGTFVARFKGANKRLFPGTSIREILALGSMKPGKYMALVVADDGEDYVVGAQYTLDVDKN
jgi:hypothetical protein